MVRLLARSRELINEPNRMTSFIISNNNRLLLLPSLEPSVSQPSKPVTENTNNSISNYHNDLDNFTIKQLLKADLSSHKRSSLVPKSQLPSHWNNYTYNNNNNNNSNSIEKLSQDALLLPEIHGRRSSQFSSISSISSDASNTSSNGVDDQYSVRSRTSIFSNESDDNGFSSSSSSSDEEEDDNESNAQILQNEFKNPPLIKKTLQSFDETQNKLPITQQQSSLPSPTPTTQIQSQKLRHIEPKESIKRPSLDELVPTSPQDEKFPQRSKRQRVGPSCDLCRSKKIKCDAHVEIMELDVDSEKLKMNKKFEIQDKPIINKYLHPSEIEEDFKLVYSNEKIIKFKSCSYCLAKGKPCVYKRGYTKDDILRYNLMHNIKKKKKTSRTKKRS